MSLQVKCLGVRYTRTVSKACDKIWTIKYPLQASMTISSDSVP